METSSISISSNYLSEMTNINTNLSSYPGYQKIAESLKKYISNENIVAGLIGCIIPESGTNHRILNATEYKGKGASGTEGWNCGEGLVQWTYWKYKLPLIIKYNNDSRSTQKLPTDWATYSDGTPQYENGKLVAQSDGKHIAGLSLDNQMLFLTIYYADLINKLKNETDVSVITAKIYQQKAGTGYYSNISDPVTRAYTTSANKYRSSSGNHFLKSLKLALQYTNNPVTATDSVDTYYADNTSNSSGSSGSCCASGSYSSSSNTQSCPNTVLQLSTCNGKSKKNVLKQTGERQNEFAALQTSMSANTPELGRTILLSAEMFDTNILKGNQEAKHEYFKDKNTDNA